MRKNWLIVRSTQNVLNDLLRDTLNVYDSVGYLLLEIENNNRQIMWFVFDSIYRGHKIKLLQKMRGFGWYADAVEPGKEDGPYTCDHLASGPLITSASTGVAPTVWVCFSFNVTVTSIKLYMPPLFTRVLFWDLVLYSMVHRLSNCQIAWRGEGLFTKYLKNLII